MPIHEDEIRTDEFLVLPASATVAEAAAAARDADGSGLWLLVIDRDGDYAVFGDATLEALGKAVEQAPDRRDFFWRELGSLKLTPVEAVEQDAVSFYEAEDRVDESDAGALVVLKNGVILGLMLDQERRGSVVKFALVDAYEEEGGDAVFSRDKEDEGEGNAED
ncbi:MAG: hypothetical protein JXB47_07875 [Anaerolineae bacterium]|nr:hypothetical protein [Anaerolineae bacterium]